MSEGRWTLPDCWEWCEAGEIADVVGGATPPAGDAANFCTNGTPWLTPADLSGYDGIYIARGRRDLSQEGLAKCATQIMPAGTVLFTSRAPIGYCVIAENAITTNQGFKSLVLKGDISPEYIRYYMLSAKDYAESLASGSTFKELSGSRMASLEVPVAPLAEQRRIVARIEALRERSGRARAVLEAMPALIDRCRKAILADAFGGDLTADWRRSQGVDTSSNGFPQTWTVQPLGNLIDEGPTNGYSPKAGDGALGPLTLKLTATTRGILDLSSQATKRIHEAIPLDSKLWLEPGDLLIQRANTLEYVGASAIYNGPCQTYIYPDLMMRIRIKSSSLREFIWRFLNSNNARSYFRENATGTAGNMPKISGRTLRALPVPVPPQDEIAEIARRINAIERRLAAITPAIGTATSHLDQLDRAVLAKAFRGELVPQDPGDEPASALLNRIRAERAATAADGARRGRRARAS